MFSITRQTCPLYANVIASINMEGSKIEETEYQSIGIEENEWKSIHTEENE